MQAPVSFHQGRGNRNFTLERWLRQSDEMQGFLVILSSVDNWSRNAIRFTLWTAERSGHSGLS